MVCPWMVAIEGVRQCFKAMLEDWMWPPPMKDLTTEDPIMNHAGGWEGILPLHL